MTHPRRGAGPTTPADPSTRRKESALSALGRLLLYAAATVIYGLYMLVVGVVALVLIFGTLALVGAIIGALF